MLLTNHAFPHPSSFLPLHSYISHLSSLTCAQLLHDKGRAHFEPKHLLVAAQVAQQLIGKKTEEASVQEVLGAFTWRIQAEAHKSLDAQVVSEE